MLLEWMPGTEKFVIRLPRSNAAKVQSLTKEHGFDFSLSASTNQEAVLFSGSPYAAVTFWDHATPSAREVLNGLHEAIAASWATSSQANIRCPSDRALEPFQRAGVAYALQNKHSLIGDQPGLGKTMQAICFANEIRAKRVLCIVPASIRLQWVTRIREWTTMPWGYIIHPILHSRHGVHPMANWTVVSYELAATDAIGAALSRERYDLLILDEAHYLKTTHTRRTRAVFGGGENRAFPALASRCDRILALTGTPLPNRPREAYTLARGLCFDSIDWISEEAFRFAYNPSAEVETNTGKVYIAERAGRTAELHNRLRGNFMVRREKHGPNGVMQQLHLPIYDLVQAETTGPVRAALAAERLLDIDPETLTGADMSAMGQIAVVRRQMGVALAPQVADYVDMCIDGGDEKLVVFAWHHEVLDILEERFAKWGVVRIDGRTSSKSKQRLVTLFQTNQNIRVCLGNILSLGVGTDGLQHVCNHAIIAEPDWVPGNNQQAFDRLDRGGQKRQVLGDIFVAPGSFAEKILASALRKARVLNNVLDERVTL